MYSIWKKTTRLADKCQIPTVTHYAFITMLEPANYRDESYIYDGQTDTKTTDEREAFIDINL